MKYIKLDDAIGIMTEHQGIRGDTFKGLHNAYAVDIVHCGECKYWEESQYHQEFMVCTYVIGATFTRQHDDFCSRGERKEKCNEQV